MSARSHPFEMSTPIMPIVRSLRGVPAICPPSNFPTSCSLLSVAWAIVAAGCGMVAVCVSPPGFGVVSGLWLRGNNLECSALICSDRSSTVPGAASMTAPVNVKNRPLQYISIPGTLPVFGFRGPKAVSCWPDGTGKSHFANTRKPARQVAAEGGAQALLDADDLEFDAFDVNGLIERRGIAGKERG